MHFTPHQTFFCPNCRWYKRSDEFYRSRSSANGLDGWCKRCRKAQRTLRKMYPTAYLIAHHSKGRSSFTTAQRRRLDVRIKNHALVFVQVGDDIYKWGNWRKPAFTSIEAFLEEQTDHGRQVVQE